VINRYRLETSAKGLALVASLQHKPTMGLEPITYRLQGGCSAGLSYVGA
jgi:hypothetical protein